MDIRVEWFQRFMDRKKQSIDPREGGSLGARFEAATRRMMVQIQGLQRSRSATGASVSAAVQLHDLEPAVRLLDELEAEKAARRSDLEREARDADGWEARAMQAVNAGDDALARQALAGRRDCVTRVTWARQDLEMIERSIAMLRPVIDMMRGAPE